jgi:hypothetical protein
MRETDLGTKHHLGHADSGKDQERRQKSGARRPEPSLHSPSPLGCSLELAHGPGHPFLVCRTDTV